MGKEEEEAREGFDKLEERNKEMQREERWERNARVSR